MFCVEIKAKEFSCLSDGLIDSSILSFFSVRTVAKELEE